MEEKSDSLKDLNLLIVAEDLDAIISLEDRFIKEAGNVEVVTPCSQTTTFINKDFDIMVTVGGENLFMFVKEVRSALHNRILPLVWVTDEKSHIIKEVSDVYYLIDGTIPPLTEILKKVSDITKVMNSFSPIAQDNTLTETDEINILRFMISRDMESIRPVIYSNSKYGYIFPALFTIAQSDVFPMLSEMEAEKMLKGEVIDRINTCKDCGSAHITLRETCPDCGSPDIKMEDYIHHFRCGYLGPESDYRVAGSDKLICPKCKRELKHIGVDYDRPSKTYVCNKCGSVFEEPNYSYLCFSCGATFNIDQVKKYNIKKYFITENGKDIAFSGTFSDILDEGVTAGENDKRFLPYNMFKSILEYEKKKARRYNVKLCLLDLYLVFDEVPVLVLREVVDDILSLLKVIVRDSDVISMSGRHIFILLSGTPCSAVDSLLKRVKSKLKVIAELRTSKIKVSINPVDVV